ncbi:hypothetical protein [Planctomicrobium sp. SH664]|uniref:hypothetical protein n=1 Tax=Planctomicrobium sp. SH664 TaxID=3448125 RepID=UPI003F5C2340
MDKLQPLIRNRFWILAGLIVPMAMYGYFSANNALKAATDARQKELDGVKQGVPKGTEPNQDYTTKLSHINTVLSRYVDEAIVDIWNHQKKRMTWPPIVAAQEPADFMGPWPVNARFAYRQDYPRIMGELRDYAEPVMPMPTMDANTSFGGRPSAVPQVPVQPRIRTEDYPFKQKLILAVSELPEAKWLSNLGIESQEMWDAQIDVWLTRLLLDAVRNINADKETINESMIRRIDKLALMGGTGVTDPSAMGMMEEGMGDEYSDYGGDYGGGEAMGMNGMGGATGNASTVMSTISFPPEQEFGLAVDPNAGGEMNELGQPTVVLPKRYIAESETAPFLERGFYMSVIIMQNKVPDFLVELTNADWPIRIKRFNIGDNPYRTESSLYAVSNPMSGGGNNPMMGMGPGGQSSSLTTGIAPRRGTIGRGGMGAGMGLTQLARTRQGSTTVSGPLATGLPPQAYAALEHPDLVQLDLCGIITIYRQPKDSIAALAAAQAAPAEGEAPAEETIVMPAVERPSADPVPVADPAETTPPTAESVEGGANMTPPTQEPVTADPAAAAPASASSEAAPAEAAPAATNP